MRDVVVEEIRSFRREIEAEFDNNQEKYLQHVYEEQKKRAERLVRLGPKPAPKRRAA